MAVHFKFRSAVNFDSISVDGNGITIASLKDKISEQKNLGRSTTFDLVIMNAESGKEYTEDSFFVPKNTSVIIKRVPAKRGRTTTLSVHDNPEDDHERPEQPPSQSDRKNTDVAQLAFTSTMDELYDMDDFGVDLYAVDESALTHVETIEVGNTSGLMAKSNPDGRRLTSQSAQYIGRDAIAKSSANGLIYGRVTPPPGYVCHRCGQPGHFIQHCPTNGDPAYDIRKGFRGRYDGEDSSLLPGVPQTNSKETDPLPPELRCPLCQGIFKDAVMIPCCQYSFCDSCVRECLREKKLCPQCGSDKPKSSDLLPNVALRQAIDRFTSSQLDTTPPNEGADVESATKVAKETSPGSQPLLTKDGASIMVMGKQPNIPVDDSVCESAIGSKEKDACEGSKPVVHVGETGMKKKKPYFRPGATSDGVVEHIGTGKPRKVNRFCFVCGSPGHIARNCPGNVGENTVSFLPQQAMFHAVGPAVPPQAMAPFGQEMFWPGQPIMPVRSLYGEGMYGPCTPMPYGAPALSVAPYGVSSYPPPMYPNPRMHGYLNGASNLTPRDRPLSREEFMELQDRERRRRLAQELQEREPSEDKPHSEDVGKGRRSPSSDSQHSLHTQWHSGNKPPGNLWRQMRQTMSSKSRQKQGRKVQVPKSDERMASYHSNSESDEDSGYDEYRAIGLAKQHSIKTHHSSVMRKSTNNLYEHVVPERASTDRDESGSLSARRRVLKGRHSRLSRQGSEGRFEHLSFEKHEPSGYVKHDGTRVSEAGAAEMLQSHHRAKKSVLEGPKVTYSDQHVKTATDSKDRHDHLALLDADEDGYEVEKTYRRRRHHGQQATSASGDEVKKKKKKRKHKKHKLEETFMEGTGGSGSVEGVVMEPSSSSKKHKYSRASDKHAMRSVLSIELPPVEEDVEEGGRWRMGDGLDGEEDMNLPKVMSKRKRHCSSKSTIPI